MIVVLIWYIVVVLLSGSIFIVVKGLFFIGLFLNFFLVWDFYIVWKRLEEEYVVVVV